MTPNFEARGESVIQLKQVRWLPQHFSKKHRPVYKTTWSWCKYGVRGVRLESRRQGGRIFTSVQAVDRFMRRINGEW